MLNAAAATVLDPNVSAVVGRRVVIEPGDKTAEVVGVVGNRRMGGPTSDVSKDLYEPLAQSEDAYGSPLSLAVDGTGPVEALAQVVRGAVRDIDPDLPIYNIVPLEDLRALHLPTERATLAVTTASSAVSLGLCAVGLYGVLAQMVARRTREAEFGSR
jgi:hypothetical protein